MDEFISSKVIICVNTSTTTYFYTLYCNCCDTQDDFVKNLVKDELAMEFSDIEHDLIKLSLEVLIVHELFISLLLL